VSWDFEFSEERWILSNRNLKPAESNKKRIEEILSSNRVGEIFV
jgi:hypothetical protein